MHLAGHQSQPAPSTQGCASCLPSHCVLSDLQTFRHPPCHLPLPAWLWLLQPTPMAVKFMQAMVQRLMWDAPWQWEQAMW